MTHTAFNRATMDFRTEVHLLIIQRSELLARSFARYLRPHYAQVHLASSAVEARAFLSAAQTPLHVVCGQRLGPADADGMTCIQRWRLEFPLIARAVLATGSEHVPDGVPGVDAVFRTPGEPQVLETLLSARFPRSSLEESHQISISNSPTISSRTA